MSESKFKRVLESNKIDLTGFKKPVKMESTKNPLDKISIIQIWQAFIKAQEILTTEYSEPFSIIFEKINNEGVATFTLEEKKTDEARNDTLLQIFPDILVGDVRLDEGFVLYDSSKIPNQDSNLLKQCESNYLSINFKPCFSGTIKLTNSPLSSIPNLDLLSQDINGYIPVTIDTIVKLDQIIENSDYNISREPVIHGIFKAFPVGQKSGGNFNFINDYLVRQLNKDIRVLSGKTQIIVKDCYLSDQEILFIKEKSDYQNLVHMLVVKVDKYPERYTNGNAEVLDILNKHIEDSLKDLNQDGLINHTVSYKKNHITFTFTEESPNFPGTQINKIKILFAKVLDQCSVIFKHNNVLTIQEVNPLDKIAKLLDPDIYKINFDKSIISFDFTNESDLSARITEINNHQLVDLNYKKKYHTFKIKLSFESQLLEIQNKLNSIPAVNTKLISNDKLLFFCHFDDHNLVLSLQSRINDLLFHFRNIATYSFDQLHEGKLKYFIKFKQKDFEEDFTTKLNFLKGEEISVVNNQNFGSLGKILKINYPTIQVSVTTLNESVYVPEASILVECVLKGEKDKLKRLSNTIDIIFSKNSEFIPNENLRSILIDSSKAQSTKIDITGTTEYQKTLQDVKSSLLSKNINFRQIEAIAKCILSNDLFIIQGPPGTGKSTAISELIWQHIRINLANKSNRYSILVTSETNLAVDNALNKLRSKNHMLIKPIRFGSEEKLDSEGKHFCFETLKKWTENGTELPKQQVVSTNVIEDWISVIASRCKRKNKNIDSKIVNLWISFLENPNKEMRQLFYNNYVINANVIGATCSSIGKLNSLSKPTRFMREFCEVFYPQSEGTRQLKSKNIMFDLVVQDEASKASPPELALPCLYGKKAVVIGDHRQLPPMVNTNEFIEKLSIMSFKANDLKSRSEIMSLIKFIEKNRDEFSISHFEKLFNAINPNLKSSFNEQYRMHPAINETIKQFYIEDGGLECGIPLSIADLEDLSHPLSRFHGVTKNKSTHVVWIDVKTPEIKNGTSRVNFGEVQAIDWLLSNFKKSPGYRKFVDYWSESEIEQKEIGIITFYGAQSNLLDKLKIKYPDVPLRISPVDRFQGMERNIVIVSLVRSNSIADSPTQIPDYENYKETGFPLQENLGFAEFPNRLNVALSRAKRLLIIVGNSKHFTQKEIYKRVYETIKNHECGSVQEFDNIMNTLKR